MSGALIVIDQIQGGPVSPGTPGVSRDDLWLLGQVHLICASVNASYDWELLDVPPGSTAVLDTPNAQTCHFTPDLIGTYLVQLITNGGGAGNVQVLTAITRFSAGGSLSNRGWWVPALGETTEDNVAGSVRGWDRPIRLIFDDLIANASFRDESYGAAPGDTWVWTGVTWGPGPGGGAIPLVGDVEQGPPNITVTRLNRAVVYSSGWALTEGSILSVVSGTSPTIAHTSTLDQSILVLRPGSSDVLKYTQGPGFLDRPAAVDAYRFPVGTRVQDFAETTTKIFGSCQTIPVDGPSLPGRVYRLDKTSEVLETSIDLTGDGWGGFRNIAWEPVSDSIWVTQNGAGGCARIDPVTMLRTLVPLPGAVILLDMFVYNGMVYATGDNGKVWQIDPVGNIVISGTPGANSIFGGCGFAGFIWVVERESGTAFRLFEATLLTDSSVGGWTTPVCARYYPGSAVPAALERVYVLDVDVVTKAVPIENPQGVMTYSLDSYVFPQTGSPSSFDILASGFRALVPNGVVGEVHDFSTKVSETGFTNTTVAAGTVDWVPPPPPVLNYTLTDVIANATVPEWRAIAPEQIMCVNTSVGALTIEAPLSTSTDAASFVVKDVNGQALLNPITVQDTANGFLFDGAPTYTLTVPYQSVTFVFNGFSGEWNLL